MSDDYELEVLCEIRQRELEKAEEEVGRAKKAWEQRRQAYQECRAKMRAQRQERHKAEERFSKDMANGHVSSGEVQAFGRYRRRLIAEEEQLELEKKQALEEVERARQKMDERKEAMTEAIRQLKAVEGHREKWEAKRSQKARRKASREMDEVASRIWRGG